MICPKKLIRMARKWQKMAALGRKRISLQRINEGVDEESCSTSSVADKGHFVVYSSDRRRFVIPLMYLDSEIMRELFQMSEEEYGIQSTGPIILPYDSVFLDYVISFIQRGVAKELERALIMSIAPSNCSSSSYFHQEQTNEQLLFCACWRKLHLNFVNDPTKFLFDNIYSENSQSIFFMSSCLACSYCLLPSNGKHICCSI